MRRVLILCLMLGLAAGCGRPLAENEAAFAGALFGDSFDVDRVQVAYDVGVFPPPRPRPMVFVEKRAKGDPCARGEPTPVTGPPAAFVAFNRIHYSQSFYTSDAMAGWPGKIRMPHALLLAMKTHVKALVVGGGAVGTGIAYHLAPRGLGRRDAAGARRADLGLDLARRGAAAAVQHELRDQPHPRLLGQVLQDAGGRDRAQRRLLVVGNLRMAQTRRAWTNTCSMPPPPRPWASPTSG
jgi:hypothetical protein